MLPVLFAEDFAGRVALGVVAYTGIMLYGAVLGIATERFLRLCAGLLLLLYLGQLPFGEQSQSIRLLQEIATLVAVGGIGPTTLRFCLSYYPGL
ncbi:MAG TPA: hypothetical protein VEI94_05710, partial [Candidatus Bathyarchaeia archaeon]|nr:hypothetical protein [Candidatus Bathyarchaeia archaeon]